MPNKPRNPKRKNLRGFGVDLKRVKEPSSEHPLFIAFTGKLGAGKGTACDFVLDKYSSAPGTGIKMSWATALKVEVFNAIHDGQKPAELSGYMDAIASAASLAFSDVPKSKTVLPTQADKIKWVNDNKNVLRPLLQWWGTDYRRTQDDEYWIKQGLATVQTALENGVYVIVNDDTRFKNEAKALHDMGFALCRIYTTTDQQEERVKARDGKFDPAMRKHPSEMDLDTLWHPFTINNTGKLWDLYPRLDALVLKILNPKPQLKEFACRIPKFTNVPQATTNSASLSSTAS